jgi:hypothetical protein
MLAFFVILVSFFMILDVFSDPGVDPSWLASYFRAIFIPLVWLIFLAETAVTVFCKVYLA